ncbi:DNA polymerase III subunit delta' [Candidatus Methylospira mobilis]|uniref:DNA polymerase III subunit delta' n=1 Tax=Candidatus Methylospira mobilis TaxID=1808979 RepID=UPI0028EE44A6|nr:DNA polymerase III subunit delta' [Candidatus Methylospira mobilis]WNV04597.1 DNA polymerase III subunit delta' [Candidatus Methylospira mobilis]
MTSSSLDFKLDELPWLLPPWRQLGRYLQSGVLPQALLLTGPLDAGTGILAHFFTRRLLCHQPVGDQACGICSSCKLFDAGNHPDAIMLVPEEPGKSILIDQVRALIATLSLKPQYGAHRVVTIAPADKLNRAAANGLLKTLEEPDARTMLLLLTHIPASLQATIRSRCQSLTVDNPGHKQTADWLKPRLANPGESDMLIAMAGGAPLRALELAGSELPGLRLRFFKAWQAVLLKKADPLQCAEQWQKTPCETLLEWLRSWVADLVRLSMAADSAVIDNSDLIHELSALSSGLNLKALFQFYEYLGGALLSLTGQANRQLVLEEALILGARLPERP